MAAGENSLIFATLKNWNRAASLIVQRFMCLKPLGVHPFQPVIFLSLPLIA
jgi:hypothetical protein